MKLDDIWKADQANLAQAPSYMLTQGRTDRSLAVTGKWVIATARAKHSEPLGASNCVLITGGPMAYI